MFPIKRISCGLGIFLAGFLVADGISQKAFAGIRCRPGYVPAVEGRCVKAPLRRRPPAARPTPPPQVQPPQVQPPQTPPSIPDAAQSKRTEAGKKLQEAARLKQEQQRLIVQKTGIETDIQAAQNSKNQFEQQYNDLLSQSGQTANNVRTSSSSGELSSVRNSLNTTAGVISGAIDAARQAGVSDADISRSFRDMGIDPQQLANNMNDLSGKIQGDLNLGDLDFLSGLLRDQKNSLVNQKNNVLNSVNSERDHVARMDQALREAEAERNGHDQNRKAHDKKADGYDEECRQKFWTCAWNTPKAVYERSLAAIDQGKMNLVSARTALLQVERLFPAMKVLVAEMIAVPFQNAIRGVEGQLQSLSNARNNLQAQIRAKTQELQGAAQTARNNADAKSRELGGLYDAKMDVRRQLDMLPINILVLEMEAARLNADADKLARQTGSRSVQAASFESSPEVSQKETQLKEAKRKAEQELKGLQAEQHKATSSPITSASHEIKTALPVASPALQSFEQKSAARTVQRRSEIKKKADAADQESMKKKAAIEKEIVRKEVALKEAERKAKEAEEKMKLALKEQKSNKGREVAPARARSRRFAADPASIVIAPPPPPPPPPSEPDRGEIQITPPPHEEETVWRKTPAEPESQAPSAEGQLCVENIPRYQQRGCIEAEEPQEEAQPSQACERGEWSPTLKTCVE